MTLLKWSLSINENDSFHLRCLLNRKIYESISKYFSFLKLNSLLTLDQTEMILNSLLNDIRINDDRIQVEKFSQFFSYELLISSRSFD